MVLAVIKELGLDGELISPYNKYSRSKEERLYLNYSMLSFSNKASCNTLEKFKFCFSPKVFSQAGIVTFVLML